MANRRLLTDIKLRLHRHELRPVYTVETSSQRVPGSRARFEDLVTISDRDNLAQAIIMRLLTPRGELTALGHPEYGSRLYELVGRENTDTTRNLAKLYILDSLQYEPRIQQSKVIRVTPVPGTRDLIEILVQVRPIGDGEIVTIGPFTQELTP